MDEVTSEVEAVTVAPIPGETRYDGIYHGSTNGDNHLKDGGLSSPAPVTDDKPQLISPVGVPSLARAQQINRRGQRYAQVVGDGRRQGGRLQVLASFGAVTGEAWARARLFEISFNEARRLWTEGEATADEIMAVFGQVLGVEIVRLVRASAPTSNPSPSISPE